MPVNIPQMNMSMFIPQMHNSNICPHQPSQKPATIPTNSSNITPPTT